jgi:arylsulfatase
VARALLLVALVAPFCACGPKPTAEAHGRGVLLISIDALRADHMSIGGYDRVTTPVLDGLAAQGVAFLNTWSTSPEVLPSHASILTGCDPLLARRPHVKSGGPALERAGWFIPNELPRLAQQFLARGFATAAFADHPAVSQIHGFARGFQEYAGFREEEVPQGQYGFENVATKFKNWLNGREVAEDWFAYVHFDDLERVWARPFDPSSDTFFPPRPELSQVPPVAEGSRVFFAVPRARWSGATLSLGEYEARYDGALRRLDQKIARLLVNLRQSGHLENTTVAIVGTHGVSLGESGLYLDSGTLSDVDLRVPMIVRPSRALDWATRSVKTNQLTSVIDLAPTLLDLLGLEVPKGMQGVSLIRFFKGRDEPVREYAFASGGLHEGTVAIDERYCLERSFPGRRGGTWISASWYGDDFDHPDEPRVFLHDRTLGGGGHIEEGVANAEVSARLARAASDWFMWIDRARAVLHRPGAARTKDEASMIEELRKRGLFEEKGR